MLLVGGFWILFILLFIIGFCHLLRITIRFMEQIVYIIVKHFLRPRKNIKSRLVSSAHK